MGEVDDLDEQLRDAVDPLAAAEQLGALLDLPSVGVDVRGARIVGQGSGASVQITLSNGEVMEFERLRDMVRPQMLVAELVACTGAHPTLKQPACVLAVALVRTLAEHLRTVTLDDTALDWGAEYLQGAETLDVDMLKQGERWAAFKHLEQIHPRAVAREHGTSLAAAGVVLRHTDGSRLVRIGWFQGYVRTEQDHTAGPAHINNRMERVGWTRRGGAGRIKATCPSRPETLLWTFYDVPADWGAE